MRVVIFIDWFAPAYKAGGPIQSIVNLVSQPIKGVEYRVVCSNKDLDGTVLHAVPFDRWVSYNDQTKVWYCSANKNVRRVLHDAEAKGAEVFFINGIYSFWYNLIPLLLGRTSKKIVSARGMLHSGALSQKSLKKKLYLRLWKLAGIPRRHFFHATNEQERAFILQALGEDVTVSIAQNLPRVFDFAVNKKKEKNSLELISIGLISPMKNYLAVLKALSKCPGRVRYTIYGPVKEPGYWSQCLETIARLPANITVVHAGDLPSSKVPDALQNAQVFVLPSKSENFGHAIFEALTAGLPVITSHATPWNNLSEAHAGFNVSPENDYELSNAICFFADADETVMAQWSAGAREYARRAINLEAIKAGYEEMFRVAN